MGGPRSGIVSNSLWEGLIRSLITTKKCINYLAKLGNEIAKKHSSLRYLYRLTCLIRWLTVPTLPISSLRDSTSALEVVAQQPPTRVETEVPSQQQHEWVLLPHLVRSHAACTELTTTRVSYSRFSSKLCVSGDLGTKLSFEDENLDSTPLHRKNATLAFRRIK